AVLFTFPSRYWFTIGRQLVFRLTPWSAWLHTKFHVHRITQEIPRRAPVFGYGPFTLYGAAFQKLHLTFALPHRAPTTPSYFKSTYCHESCPLASILSPRERKGNVFPSPALFLLPWEKARMRACFKLMSNQINLK